jgi:hypothetical protein
MLATYCSRISHLQSRYHVANAPLLALTPTQNLRPQRATATDERLRVDFAQRTFDSEGLEQAGPYFSRTISWPKLGNSGVTIGRGYDMGLKSPQQVVRELTTAGMSLHDARFLARGALKRGGAAGQFVAEYRASAPVMSLEVQKRLFESITTPQMINDIKRIFNKPETVAAYGQLEWNDLSSAAQELVFDLRYRGDYTPKTRRVLQPLLVNHDYKALKELINDTGYWASLGVPTARIKERQRMVDAL